MSFFFSVLSFFFKLRERERGGRERERERGGYLKLGIRRNGPKVYLSFVFDGVPVENLSSFTG